MDVSALRPGSIVRAEFLLLVSIAIGLVEYLMRADDNSLFSFDRMMLLPSILIQFVLSMALMRHKSRAALVILIWRPYLELYFLPILKFDFDQNLMSIVGATSYMLLKIMALFSLFLPDTITRFYHDFANQ